MWVIGSLAIGMAVAMAALALLNGLLVLPFPEVTDQKRLVRVAVSRNCAPSTGLRAVGPDCWVRMSSIADYMALREGLHGVQGLVAYAQGQIAVALPEARSMRGVLTSANYFDVLGVRPVVGRVFDANDADTNAAVVVIAYNVWTREFDADPAVVGRSIRVADQFVQIVGVAPALFGGIDRIRSGGGAPDVWLPLWLADRVLPLTATEQRRQERDLAFVGRLGDGVDVPQLQAEAEVLAVRLAASRNQASQRGLGEVRRVWRVDPKSWHFGVVVVMPIPILVLAIACVNAANLMLARGSQRQREIAIRLAIGAGRGRIVRQLLLESAVLAGLATAVAVPIAWWSLHLASNPLGVPIPIDATVLAFTILTAGGATVAFGLAPAVRVSAQRPSSTLGSAARSDDIPRQSRLRRLLVIAQVALSLGLMATAWQLVATVRSQAVSGGTPADRLLIARFDLQPLKLPAGETEGFYRDLVAAASRLPGVEAAGVARATSVWTFGQGAAPGSIVVRHPTDGADDGRVTIGGYAGGDLLEAVGVRIVAGRGFSEADRQLRPQVAVVNQTFAQNMNGPAVGSLLRVAPREHDVGSSIDVRIVGVIEPVLEPRYTPDGPPAAKIYLPSPIEPEPALALYVRTRATATTLAQPVLHLVSRIAPRVPILELGSLEELNERSFGQQLWLARAAAFLGVVGLLLATAGLYGVSSYVVAMRSREIAIRIAVGAAPRVILAMVLGQSMRMAVIGLVVGGGAAVVVSRLIQSGYHGIHGFDGVAFAGAATLFVAAMLLASLIPAVRASRLDPIENLKDG
jgi:putative ABC transport system permease protein